MFTSGFHCTALCRKCPPLELMDWSLRRPRTGGRQHQPSSSPQLYRINWSVFFVTLFCMWRLTTLATLVWFRRWHSHGKTADLKVVQKTFFDALSREGETQKVIAKEAGCSLSFVSKHIKGKLNGKEKNCRKRCTSNRDNHKFERIVKRSPFKNMEGFMRRGLSQTYPGHSNCCSPCASEPLLTQRQRLRRLVLG